MSRRHRREYARRVVVTLLHLLKWRYQPERRSQSWRRTLTEQRRQLARLLQRYPRLQPQVPALLSESYQMARAEALTETRLPDDTFPPTCPWTAEQILDEHFWPWG